MNRTIIVILMIAFGQSIAAQTYYYRYTKAIIKGEANTNVSGGQFITFDGKKCYESDRSGNNVGNGLMAYDTEVSKSTGLETYWGSCYWSKNANMKFNADRSLLNIETNSGKIYVYKRATAPSGATTCSLIRKSENSGAGSAGGGVYVADNPTQPNFSQGGSGSSFSTRRNSSSGSSNISSDRKEKVRRTCAACNGQKEVVREDGSVPLYGASKNKKRCYKCGKEYWEGTFHRHQACPTCHGKGYVEYWL